MSFDLLPYLFLSGLLFILGFLGVALNRHHGLRTLIALEVLMLSVHLLFVSLAAQRGIHIHGHILSLFVLALTAAEAALGLVILLHFHRDFKITEIKEMRPEEETE